MRILGYLWAFPVTCVGLLLALLAVATGGSMRLRGGIIEVWGGLTGRLLRGGRGIHGGAAATLGHVVLARDADCMRRSLSHELHHVRQLERWGPLLPLIYWLISVKLRLQGLDPYLDHPMEPPPQ